MTLRKLQACGFVLVMAALVSMASASSTAAETILKLSSSFPPTHAAVRGLELMAKEVGTATKNDVQIRLFVASQLGDEKATIEGTSLGTIEMGSTGYTGLTELDLLYAPYLFRDAQHWVKFVDGPVVAQWKEKLLKSRGIRILTIFDIGVKHTTSNRPIRTPADLTGLKFRVPQLPIMLATWKALGANPTPMSFSELFMALKQGVVDGQENGMFYIMGSGFHEVQKHLILTAHLRSSVPVYINEEVYQKLPDVAKRALTESARAARDFVIRTVEAEEARLISEAKAKGMNVIQPDLAAFQKATEGVLAPFAKAAGIPDLKERVEALR